MAGTLTKAAVIEWAIEESGYSVPELAAKMEEVKVNESLIVEWIRGDSTPTQGQLTELAKVLKRQRAVFYMKSPPASSDVEVELRTANGAGTRPLLPDERLKVREAMSLQRLVSWLSRERAECSLPKAKQFSDIDQVAGDIIEWLQVSHAERVTWESDGQAYRTWKGRLEALGVLVLELQLGKDGVRGFSAFDRFSPLIAVNTAESSAARTFTLMHELAHLVVRKSGSCLSTTLDKRYDLEQWCDRVAGEVLVPDSTLSGFVAARPRAQGLDLVLEVATAYRTSLRAAAVALGRLDSRFKPLYSQVEKTFPTKDREKPPARGRGGLTRCERRLREAGGVACRVIIDAWRDQRINERDARQALGLDGYELDVVDGILRARIPSVD